MIDTKIAVFNPVYKQQINNFLKKFFAQKQEEFSQVNNWGSDVSKKLSSFISQGKMIRGSLILFIHEAYTGKITEEAIKIAVAMELFHSSLLIHDDIMDNDTLRRGNQTIFAQYQSFAESKKCNNAHHFGESMGICVGDIGFFLGFQILSAIPNQAISRLCMNEMISVGLAQMQDVYSGYTKDAVTQSDIEQVYLYKTGRYTFSLPMMMGALLAGQKDNRNLERLGECLGIIFQHTDDALSLFGSEIVTGKPEGSDIRENKKTLYRLYLYEKVSDTEKQRLEMIFGNQEITSQDIAFVRKLMQTLGIQKIMDEKMHMLQKQAKDHIIQLQISKKYQEALEQVIGNIIERKK
ncbi:MAG TPA: polyprenyl synthetase family protein [Candidatus Saccharimonadales bacterium]|nr:polyprenyl synthetase family protein [Candidatus Saccharimonadales bacterium]